MSTIEDRLHDLGRAVTPPPLPGASAVMRRGRQRRHRRRGGFAAALVIAGAGGAAGATALWPDGGPSVRTAVPPSNGDAPDLQPATTPAPTSTSAPSSAPTTTGAPPATGGTVAVAVPDVTGLRADRARTVLEELGFVVESVGDVPGDAVVLAQDPLAGTHATVGQTIRIEIG